MSTIIRIAPHGRMANLMMQLMFALSVQRLAKTEITIEGYDLPEWGLKAPYSQANSVFAIGYGTTRADVIANAIDRYQPSQVGISYIIPRVSNYLPRTEYEEWFPLLPNEGVQTGPDELVIHVRLSDVGVASNPVYGPLPISYYRYLIDRAKLRPVFMGELDSSAYCAALRAFFPTARFLGPQNARDDFQTIRRAHNIALSVGSFSWVAAYLSEAHSIHMPLSGMFDFRDRPQNDLLPTDDARFIYHVIPAEAWANRYVDFHAMDAKFCTASKFLIAWRRAIAAARTCLVRGRIRFEIERKLFINAIQTI